jgi:hypothetical protein
VELSVWVDRPSELVCWSMQVSSLALSSFETWTLVPPCLELQGSEGCPTYEYVQTSRSVASNATEVGGWRSVVSSHLLPKIWDAGSKSGYSQVMITAVSPGGSRGYYHHPDDSYHRSGFILHQVCAGFHARIINQTTMTGAKCET